MEKTVVEEIGGEETGGKTPVGKDRGWEITGHGALKFFGLYYSSIYK